MTDAELLAALENEQAIPVPYFDNASLPLSGDDLAAQDVLGPLKNFLALTADDRLKDARHLFAYCRHTIVAVGEDEVLEDMGGEMPSAESIWNHVKPRHVFFGEIDAGKYAETRTIYIQVEAEVDWEPEHGLQMSWANGSRLVKSGAYDGHPTNGHAFANPDLDRYIFYCDTPELCTFP